MRTRVVTSSCLPVTNLILVQGCTKLGPVNFLAVAHNIFSIISDLFSCILTRVIARVPSRGPVVRCTGYA